MRPAVLIRSLDAAIGQRASVRIYAQHWLFFLMGALSVSTRPLVGAVTGDVLGSLRAIS